MSIAIVAPNRDLSTWVEALQAQDPALKIEIWPEINNPEQVEFVLCWNHPAGIFQQFPNLKCISSLGAGVNHLLNDSTCPTDIPLVRLVDDDLKQSMAEYVMLGILEHFRRFKNYCQQQASGEWIVQQIPHVSTIGVGIMGCGELGHYVADKVADFGFKVSCWSRLPKHFENMTIFSERDELGTFLKQANILVCLLPLTPATENILNTQTFNQLPPNAYLINAARGAHLVDRDLLLALDSGQLSGALLDVFREEPLPRHHPFWSHNKITVTPHVASITNPDSAALQILKNYHRAIKGKSLSHLVDRKRGY